MKYKADYDKIARIAVNAGLTFSELSREMGHADNYLSYVHRNGDLLSQSNLMGLANILNCEVEDLLADGVELRQTRGGGKGNAGIEEYLRRIAESLEIIAEIECKKDAEYERRKVNKPTLRPRTNTAYSRRANGSIQNFKCD